ncbi:Pimeloyl-ACP methyl ester carboxylesterase [Amycolatopsis xylanica]|uniref:Pimeloyl-ACP methyl ester carboxylesterase n=1 Tax=Amycolatopsis xylanica TaxID=589385 RepID=A0A1H2UMP7_9PSEU|nr:alpha/beta hydrolase [Amycolatopsis xylanica]SDW57337.1 Pimeloyl-ACP methyl ester carboxylesterase [Amycolatopsis xylanica]
MSVLGSVVSRDGSVVGFEVTGHGRPLVLVHGGTADRSRWAPVLRQLADRFTVYAVDRRGRGLSTAEAETYALAREGEDIAAVAEAAGRDVYVVAHSYGALCSLEAATITDAIGRMVLYEPPIPTRGNPVFSAKVRDRIRSAPDPQTRLETFFREVIHVPESELPAMRRTPVWQARLAAVHTIVRELDAVEEFTVSDRLTRISVPVRLFLGTESPAYFAPAAEAVAAALPHADVVPLHGQDHLAIDRDPEQFVAQVLGFVSGMAG